MKHYNYPCTPVGRKLWLSIIAWSVYIVVRIRRDRDFKGYARQHRLNKVINIRVLFHLKRRGSTRQAIYIVERIT